MHGMQLHEEDGQRKYLTPEKRDTFLKAAEDAPREVRTFCATLVYSACRITEELGLTTGRADLKVPLNMVQEWLGHAELSTAAIYVDADSAAAQTNRSKDVGLMAYKKTIVCLANSIKQHPGRCIAGKEVLPGGEFGDWIRPIGDRPSDEVLPSEFRYPDNSVPKLLDIIDVPLLRSRPNDHQKENHVIDASKRWQKRGSIPAEQLSDLRDKPKTLWINNHQTETKDGIYNCLTPEEATTQTYSLTLIRPEDFVIIVASKTWDGVTKKKCMTRFRYNSVVYALSLTDPVATDAFRTKDEGEYALENVDICVSLTEPNLKEMPPRCYKLVAAIFSEEPF